MRVLYHALAALVIALLPAVVLADDEAVLAASNATSLTANAAASCFPAIGFHPPKGGRAPTIPSYKWWCRRDSEYAFLGTCCRRSLLN